MHNVTSFTKKRGVVRSCELEAFGISRAAISRLVKQGHLIKVGHGLYRDPNFPVGRHHMLAQGAKRVKSGVVCLLSALDFHKVTTQLPHQVWMALPPTARTPRMIEPPLRIFIFSGPSYTEGIEEHLVEGVKVNVYSLAKTVADCFKFRNKVGLDVALEALRECQKKRGLINDEIWKYAKIDRVANVIRPYLEALS